MSSKTKIVVLHMKEVVYTAVFLALAIFMLILVFTMFHKKDPDDAGARLRYCRDSGLCPRRLHLLHPAE